MHNRTTAAATENVDQKDQLMFASAYLGWVIWTALLLWPLSMLEVTVLLQAAELVLATAASSAHLQWIGYLSSTSVYGDWGGSWVDERSGQACWYLCPALC